MLRLQALSIFDNSLRESYNPGMERSIRPEVETPSFEDVMSLAQIKFIEKETIDPTLPGHPLHGELRVGNTFMHVSCEVVDGLVDAGVNVAKLTGKLISEATFPLTTNLDINDYTFEGVYVALARRVVAEEMPLRFPDLVRENKIRSALTNDEV